LLVAFTAASIALTALVYKANTEVKEYQKNVASENYHNEKYGSKDF